MYDPEVDYFIEFSFKIGDYVRLVIEKEIFSKGYTPNWTDEIYVINLLNPSIPPTYQIKSLKGVEYEMMYYKQQLQKVPAKEFPFDSFEVLAEKGDKILVQKLKSEDQEKTWVKRVQPSRKVKVSI
jgi:hypothetical protein